MEASKIKEIKDVIRIAKLHEDFREESTAFDTKKAFELLDRIIDELLEEIDYLKLEIHNKFKESK